MRAAAIAAFCCLTLAACGFDVKAPDDFLLTRTGQGPRVTLLVNDGGTIRCNGSRARAISSTMLIDARDLVQNLTDDADASLRIPEARNTVYRYTFRMQAGTVAFPDTAAARHHELAGVEQFALRALAGPCKRLGR
jgi:hypothetical protein